MQGDADSSVKSESGVQTVKLEDVLEVRARNGIPDYQITFFPLLILSCLSGLMACMGWEE
jgi:hypothetical protein